MLKLSFSLFKKNLLFSNRLRISPLNSFLFNNSNKKKQESKEKENNQEVPQKPPNQENQESEEKKTNNQEKPQNPPKQENQKSKEKENENENENEKETNNQEKPQNSQKNKEKPQQQPKKKGYSDYISNNYIFLQELWKKFQDFNKKYKISNKYYFIGITGLSIGALLLYYYLNDPTYIITYEKFLELFSLERVVKIQMIRKIDGSFYQTYAKVFLTSNEIKLLNLGNIDHFLEKLENLQKEKGKTSDQYIKVEFKFNGDPYKDFDRISHFIYTVTTGVLIYYIIRGSPVSGKHGASKTKIYGIDTNINVKFKDVAGLDEAKLEINEFVDFLKKPAKYKEMGARLPKGALLSGPPGTGKTMLAKACAGEAGVPFLYLSGSEFVEVFVGLGASRVRDLFNQAKEKSPSIIFIDEIDAVGKKREARFGGHDERDNTLNQLLVEMDGFGTDVNVVVLAATNKRDVLDPALTRPGRFDRLIEVNLPDLLGRKEIFLVHLRHLKLDPSKTIEQYALRLATLTPGFSGADIANLCNESAILAARKNKLFVESEDFEISSERVIAGLERKKFISKEEKKIIAFHESGHGVVSWFLEGGNPLLKLTIIPRSKGSLGFAQYLPNESTIETKEELKDKIACILGGRCCEEIFFGKVTTGAADDLQKAYRLASNMVVKNGMSEYLGYIAFKEEEFVKKHSEATQNIIDQEIKKLIEEATEKSRNIIKTHKNQIEKLATSLIEKETLDLDAILEILGERPFPIKENFKAYLESKKLSKVTV